MKSMYFRPRYSVLVLVLSLFFLFSLFGYALEGDLTGDDIVDWGDLVEFVSQWMGDFNGPANFNGDDNIDIDDFTVLAGNWLKDSPSVFISEFMALNQKTLADGNGVFSDWIELYNPSTRAINLDGWYLTDAAGTLTKWRFPAVTIASKGYLVVFASGAGDAVWPCRDSLGYYHTNFKLSGDGEYLALVRPDGSIAHEYQDYELSSGERGFPPQTTNVSYGVASSVITAATLVGEAAAKKVFIPASDIGAAWRGGTEPFNDSLWEAYTFMSNRSGGVGYDNETTYLPYLSYDVKSAMYGKNASCYIRIPFSVESEGECTGLTLKVRYDDGFVAYLNGIEIASANKPTTLLYNSPASTMHNDALAVLFESYDVSAHCSLLRSVGNVLAIQGLNTPINSSDFLISVQLESQFAIQSAAATGMYFSVATPGKINTGAYADTVETPKFSSNRGFYTAPFTVGLSCDTKNSVIRYTTDGSTPSMNNGQTYTGWIPISKTTCLRAMAYKAEPGWQPSAVKTQTYLFVSDVITQSETAPTGWPSSSVNNQVYNYGMDPDITLTDARYASLVDDALLAIPTVSLVTDIGNLVNASTGIYSNPQQDGKAWERPVSVELIYPDGTEGFQINAGLRLRGGMSRQPSNPKHSFRLFFRSEYGDSKLKYPLFGDEGADSFDKIDFRTAQNISWNLPQGAQNATWLYDIFTRDAHRDMGQPYSRGRYYHIYLNGIYWGLYQTDERPSADFGQSYFGGSDEDYDAVKSDNDNGQVYAADGTIDGYYELWTRVDAGVSSVSDYFRIQGMNADGTRNPGYTRYLDVDNLIDYMLIVFYAGNRDMPIGPPGGDKMPRNLFAVYNRANPDGFKFIAHDSENTLTISGLAIDRVSVLLSSALGLKVNCNPWWIHSKLKSNPEYALRFSDHVQKHFFNAGALTPNVSAARWLARADEISMAIIAESARWGDFLTPAKPRTKDDDWLPVVNAVVNNYFKNSTSTRTAIALAQLKANGLYPTVNAPVFNQHGGYVSTGFSLTMSAPAGTIYYTQDGSDPRTVGTGAVSPSASAYTSAISLNRSVTVKARARSGSTWSALTQATFSAGNVAGNLRITELMYHSYDENSLDTPSLDYIELQNRGLTAINLNLVRFSDGIDFTFPNVTLAPGEYVLVVEDSSSFAAQYGGGLNAAGVFTGQLSNAGERLVLKDALDAVIHDFEYKDGWYPITDGQGFSLTVINPDNAEKNTWSQKSGWRPSVRRYGSPGTEDSANAHNPGDVVINEVLAHSNEAPRDWIELHNTTDHSISIGGWFLSDSDADDTKLRKYQIPTGTSIPASGYVVFTADDHFGAFFGLSENGESVFLSSAQDQNGVLTGYRETVDFGASDPGVSFGRYRTSIGAYDFTAMSRLTRGTENAVPQVGPIIISEIMYHPDWLSGSLHNNDEFEYIELYNNSSEDIMLYDDTTGVPWTFTKGIDYTFSSSLPVTLASHSYIVLVKNPTAFSQRYPTVSADNIYGPYSGKLQNDGEAVEISKPGDIKDGQRCYIRVDYVDYSDDSDVWPSEADGGGKSLTRLGVDSYGNDPASWQAAVPSPGQ